jgi:flagellar hook-associated protein 2
MSSVSFTGLATGMDTASLVSQLVELKRTPIYRLEAQKSGFQNQVSALNTLKEKLLALQEAALAIDTANEFASLTGSSSNEDAVRLTVGENAAPGTYDIAVTTLATAQKSRSQGFDDRLTDVGEGTFSVTIDGEVQTLDLTGYTSLEGLAERINNEIDGLNATIVYDGSDTGGYSLVLTGDSGSAGAFTIDASGLAGGTAPTFTNLVEATDAVVSIDGIAINGAGNQLTDAISGLTIDLVGVTDAGGSVQLTVSTDAAGVKDQVKTFVDAYNDLFSFYESATGATGKLNGNSTARSIATRMENLMTSSHAGGGAFTMLAQIGIERQQGTKTLDFDETAFADALAENYAAVRDLFIERDGSIGKASLVDAAVEELTDSIDGMFKIGTESLNRRIDNIDSSIERYERSIENYRTTLERKFLAMESAVSLMQAQGNYLSSMVFTG